MGCGYSMPAEVGAPPKPICVIGEQHVFDDVRYFMLKEKVFSWSGDDFEIMELSTKTPMYKISGKALSVREKKELLDMDGNVLLDSTATLLSFAAMHNIYVNDQRLVTIRNKLTDWAIEIFLLEGKVQLPASRYSRRCCQTANRATPCVLSRGVPSAPRPHQGLTRDSPATDTGNMTPDIVCQTGIVAKEFAFYAGDPKNGKCIARVRSHHACCGVYCPRTHSQATLHAAMITQGLPP